MWQKQIEISQKYFYFLQKWDPKNRAWITSCFGYTVTQKILDALSAVPRNFWKRIFNCAFN